MIALYVLGGVAALVVLLCLLPAVVRAEYDAHGPNITAYVGPVSVFVFPRPKFEKKKNTQRSPQKAKKKKKPKKQETTKAPAEKSGGDIGFFRQLLGLALEAQSDLRCHLRIRMLVLHLTIGGQGDNPATAATLYGSAWAAIGSIMPLLERAFRVEQRDVQAFVDFLSTESSIYFQAECRLRVGTLLRILAVYGLRGLKLYRNKKGGTKNGTSNQ